MSRRGRVRSLRIALRFAMAGLLLSLYNIASHAEPEVVELTYCDLTYTALSHGPELAAFGDRVHFLDLGSHELDECAKAIIRGNADWLIANPSVTLLLEGHTYMSEGTRAEALELGRRRAEAVRAQLISLGVAGDRIRVESYGKERPIVLSNRDVWENRRVVFYPDSY